MDLGAESARVTAVLVERYPTLPAETIQRLVARTFTAYGDAKVQAYLPLLVHREVEAQLRALERSDVAPLLPSGRSEPERERVARVLELRDS